MTQQKSTRPIVQLIDLLGKKWVLRILWELNQSPCTFRELQARCGDISPTIINTRIKDLCAAGFVGKSPESGYELTKFGMELIDLFHPLNNFAARWAEENNS